MIKKEERLEYPLREKYKKESCSALQAQFLAEQIAFAPFVFQASRLMLKFGIFRLLSEHTEGQTITEVATKSNISEYAAQVLLESSLTAGTLLLKDGRFILAKAGWFLMNDKMAQANMNFVNDVCYQGMFNLEESLLNGKPEGLKVFGSWPTVYEGLSSLPKQAQKSWFEFDHYYSDTSFDEALRVVFAQKPVKLLDVGGNTGRWATQCVTYSPDVNVTIVDLPQQLELMKKAVSGIAGADRISGYAANLLDDKCVLPKGYDVLWMSQFLDCFSEKEATSILCRAANAMSPESTLFIMETFWDRQRFDTASFCIAQTSLYFTAIANGNSKMFHSSDLMSCINNAGLEVVACHDGIGLGHSIVECRLPR